MWFKFFSSLNLSPFLQLSPVQPSYWLHITTYSAWVSTQRSQCLLTTFAITALFPLVKQVDQMNSYTCVTDHLMSHRPPLKQLFFFLKVIYTLKLKLSNCRPSKNWSEKKKKRKAVWKTGIGGMGWGWGWHHLGAGSHKSFSKAFLLFLSSSGPTTAPLVAEEPVDEGRVEAGKWSRVEQEVGVYLRTGLHTLTQSSS